jgi:hypothetical protein
MKAYKARQKDREETREWETGKEGEGRRDKEGGVCVCVCVCVFVGGERERERERENVNEEVSHACSITKPET